MSTSYCVLQPQGLFSHDIPGAASLKLCPMLLALYEETGKHQRE